MEGKLTRVIKSVIKKRHKSVIKNKEFGEGVKRIYREMEEAGLEAPSFKKEDFMTIATIKNKNVNHDGTHDGTHNGTHDGTHDGTHGCHIKIVTNS